MGRAARRNPSVIFGRRRPETAWPLLEPSPENRALRRRAGGETGGTWQNAGEHHVLEEV